MYTIPAHAGLISSVKFAPTSGEFLLSSSYDGSVRAWSARDWSLLATIAGHEGRVSCVDVGVDEASFVTCGFDRTFKVWAHESRF